MTLPRSAAEVVAEHVTLELACIDRMMLGVRQPRLQYGQGIHGFFVRHRGNRFASPALMEAMTRFYVASVEHFIAARGVPRYRFVKGERKDDVTHRFLAGHDGGEGVLYVGVAQERARTWTSTRRAHSVTGFPLTWLVPADRLVKYFYFYCVDEDFGPFLLRVCTYFPFNAQLVINGHHWAQRQAAKAGLGFTALDNAFADCEDPAALQAICDRFGGAQIEALLAKWLRILPSPFTEEDEILGGYAYQLTLRETEFSLTHTLDRPLAARVFLDQVIHDNLDLGRPDQVGLIFKRQIRRRGKSLTPGRFRTRVLTNEVTASLHIDYKSTRAKQYQKEGRALRTEITINDTWDFGLPKQLSSLPALRQLGFTAARRLLGVQTLSHDPLLAADTLTRITRPLVTAGGTRIPALRFADPRVHALLQVLLLHRFVVHGFTNRDLRHQVAPLLGRRAEHIRPGSISYDLRRLRAHGLITRTPGTLRYQPTDLGYHTALLFTHAHDHLLRTGLAELHDHHTPLRRAADAFRDAYTDLAKRAHLAA
jgi:hypothetical protein